MRLLAWPTSHLISLDNCEVSAPNKRPSAPLTVTQHSDYRAKLLQAQSSLVYFDIRVAGAEGHSFTRKGCSVQM